MPCDAYANATSEFALSIECFQGTACSGDIAVTLNTKEPPEVCPRARVPPPPATPTPTPGGCSPAGTCDTGYVAGCDAADAGAVCAATKEGTGFCVPSSDDELCSDAIPCKASSDCDAAKFEPACLVSTCCPGLEGGMCVPKQPPSVARAFGRGKLENTWMRPAVRV